LSGTPSVPPPLQVQLFSFQVGKAAQQLTQYSDGTMVDLGQDFRSFDDTASALKQMDLLVTCDTSVGHLAGCMGIPTWWLIPAPPDWRHIVDVGTSPWYKEARLFRQRIPKDWDSVMEAVVGELHEWVKYA
jgi:ADP-heptose:LPS heptosyltransferase